MIYIQLDPRKKDVTDDGFVKVVCRHFRPDLLKSTNHFDFQVNSLPEKPDGGYSLYAHPDTHEMKWVEKPEKEEIDE